MAQFNIAELGGPGQWMSGGMTMVGDMFNNALKTTVNNLCQELATLIKQQGIFEVSTSKEENGGPSETWWPSEWGMPSSSGSQNNLRYAYFSSNNRLAINNQGSITIYDTLQHTISGVSQQQGASQLIQFTSQFGQINIQQLPIIEGATKKIELPENNPASSFLNDTSPTKTPNDTDSSKEIFTKIERLAELHKKGILNEEEYRAKKKELLDLL